MTWMPVHRLLLVVTAGLVTIGCSTTTPTVRPLTTSTAITEQAGPDAAERLENLSTAAHLERGSQALHQANLPIARLHFSMAIAKDPDLMDAYLGLAQTLVQEGHFAGAKTALGKILETHPEHVKALTLLGHICRAEGRSTEAVRHLRRANEVQADNPSILTELAMALEQMGHGEQAQSHYRQVVILAPRTPSAYNNLGFSLLLQEKYAEAVSVLEQGHALDSVDRVIKNNLALAYALDGQSVKALQLFEASVGRAGAYNNLGYLLMLQGDLRVAESALNRAMEANPVFYVRARENLDQVHFRGSEGRQLFD